MQGERGRHVCPGEARDCGGARCQAVSGRHLEPLVSRLVLQALSPAAIALSRAVAANAEQDRKAQHEAWDWSIRRAEQETGRIFRQYDAVEPENRMVARSLEARYEAALVEQRRLGEDYERFCRSMPMLLSDAEWRRIRSAAQDIARPWGEGGSTAAPAPRSCR